MFVFSTSRNPFLHAIISLLVFSGCSGPEQGVSENVFRYNESKGITSLDPAYARNQTNIWPVSQLFNGLVQLDDQLKVQPAIAKSWSISEDGREYTFTLRKGIKFHPSGYFVNQEERMVDAGDFVYSFERILNPEVASPGRWIFDYVDDQNGFAALNDTTLRICLDQPFPPFLSLLSMPYCSVVPEDIVDNPETEFSNRPVGTGPFMFKYWSPEEKLILVRNDEYFELDQNGDPLPYLDAVSISFIKDKQSEFLEFLKGDLDFISGVHPAYKDELLTRSGKLNPEYEDRIQLFTEPYLNTEYLGILQEPAGENDPILLDINIRKAINYGFDRSKMMKYLRNNLGYPATGGMIPPGLPGCIGPGEGYTYNPDLAREYIGRSEYADSYENVPIELTTTSDYLDLCEYIQFELGKIGLNVKISVMTGGAFRNMVANANLQFFRGSWIADYADAENYLALFYSGNFTPGGPNYTRFSSDRFDELYEKAIRTSDEQIRFELYSKMDSIVMHNAVVVPLYYDMVVRFVQTDVTGFNPNPMNNLLLKYVRKPGK
ncbi:MAG: ABC transporter substrate-binding protein [Bacteroidales bacterium]|nr:ABC transporter substrate-binding protein [Bacteroidales bacterium]